MSPYKIVSLLLQYPEVGLHEAAAEIEAATAALPRSRARASIRKFLRHRRKLPLIELQKEYVETFDFGKMSGLYLSFYAYGDRRQRGVAMVELKHRYAAAGLPLLNGELPDYLPAMLEFASLAPAGHGARVLSEFRPALELVRRGVKQSGSPYAHLLDAVVATLPKLSLADRDKFLKLAADGPPAEQVGLEPFAPPATAPAEAAATCGAAR